jgi:hypothetical protein
MLTLKKNVGAFDSDVCDNQGIGTRPALRIRPLLPIAG